MRKSDKGFVKGKKAKRTSAKRSKGNALQWIREIAHLSEEERSARITQYVDELRRRAWGPSAREKYEQLQDRRWRAQLKELGRDYTNDQYENE